MEERKADRPDVTLQTVGDIQLALTEARQRAAIGDVSGADERVQEINRLVQGESVVVASLVDELARVRRLWLGTLADLVPVLETQGAYREALAYTRILLDDDPAREPDLLRLIHLYVLGGSRAPALTALGRRFAAAVRAHGSLVLIEGVAGIGKTSLARVCATWARRRGAIFARGVVTSGA